MAKWYGSIGAGTSAVNYMCGSMELMCCKNCWLCSAFWMTKVSSTYLSHSLGGLESHANGLSFKLFHELVEYNGTDGGTHGYPVDIFTLDEEIGIFQTEFQQCGNVLYRHGGPLL